MMKSVESDNLASVYIAGVRIHRVNSAKTMSLISSWIRKDVSPRHVATVNPEFVVFAQSNPEFRSILNAADLDVADGGGILPAAQFIKHLSLVDYRGLHRFIYALLYGVYCGVSLLVNPRALQAIPETVAGVDLVDTICRQAASNGWRVFLLGGWGDVSSKAARVLRDKYPGLIINSFSGAPRVMLETKKELEETLGKVTAFRSDVLLVGYGFPHQDFWIFRHKHKLPCRVVIGIGGALDMISGRLPRAPLLVRKFHLEWLWRLCLQPSRFRRIFSAVVAFPLLVFREGLRRNRR